MHELIEGLKGVEVVADDFMIVGRGKTMDEGIKDHNESLINFLQRCKEKSLQLNIDKIQLRRTEISYIGHKATNKGIRISEGKIEAILKMESPKTRQG